MVVIGMKSTLDPHDFHCTKKKKKNIAQNPGAMHGQPQR